MIVYNRFIASIPESDLIYSINLKTKMGLTDIFLGRNLLKGTQKSVWTKKPVWSVLESYFAAHDPCCQRCLVTYSAGDVTCWQHGNFLGEWQVASPVTIKMKAIFGSFTECTIKTGQFPQWGRCVCGICLGNKACAFHNVLMRVHCVLECAFFFC